MDISFLQFSIICPKKW